VASRYPRLGWHGAVSIKIKEDSFKDQVTQLAELLGWEWVHWRPLRTKYGWSTPYDGPLGPGWPDLHLIRKKDHRQALVELKSQDGKLRPEQGTALIWLTEALVFPGSLVYVGVWYPSSFDDGTILGVLQ
jgi:hypothetical protein